MKYRIPEIGDNVRLAAPWTFTLGCEDRNETMYKLLPKRYEVPDWIQNTDWRTGKHWENRKVQVPGKPKGHVIGFVKGRRAKTPLWLGVFRHKIELFCKCGDGHGNVTGARYTLSYEAEDNLLTLPAGEELSVDRVYIRQGAADFSSVSFRYPEKKARFFVSLADALTMDFEFVGHTDKYNRRVLRASFGGTPCYGYWVEQK